MGAGYVDYILADPWVIPAEQRQFYAEQVVWLPGCYQVNDARRAVAERVPSRAEAGLPERGFVFCAFERSNKITPPYFDVWMDLLKEIPQSVLWLRNTGPAAVANLRREAIKRGVGPERLVFAPLAAQADHLARHLHADLFLDTAPYNAHTTASDALWMGVPVLTRVGGAFPSRVAASVLSAAGLPELIAASMEDYRRQALELARDPSALAALKAKIAGNRATMPLFDTACFTRHIEAAYTTMWQRAQAGQAPAGFAVAP
jgi:predicted O-linked N-acetylglucosamine transferase (SPINDLY family)